MSPHPIVHIEFSAKDLEKAARFYADLFGWQVEQLPEMSYATFQPEAGPGGGFSRVSEQNRAGTTVVYIQTDDIEATLTKAESLGGKTLVPKDEVPGMGWFALFSDPSGNMVGLWTPRAGQ